MRVLVVHNRYSSEAPSGENLQVDDEVRWLRDADVDVHLFAPSSDDIHTADLAAKARIAGASMWSPSAQRRARGLMRAVQPDVVHVHNLFPLLTTSVPWVATQLGIPVVWTVHNRRITCVNGTQFRDGNPCDLCGTGWRVAGMAHRCYRGSALGSILMTGATSIFRSFARRHVVALAVSRSLEDWLVTSAGYDPSKVIVKYNGIEPPVETSTIPAAARQRTFLFAGYLSEYKGVSLLLHAWERAELPGDVELRILGEGPLAAQVDVATRRDSRVRWLGNVPNNEVRNHLREARAVLVPSLWPESLPRTALEALAFARPVITSGEGGLSEVVDERSGWLAGTTVRGLTSALEAAATDDAEISRRSVAAVERYRANFSPDATTRQLLRIYARLLDRSVADDLIDKCSGTVGDRA